MAKKVKEAPLKDVDAMEENNGTQNAVSNGQEETQTNNEGDEVGTSQENPNEATQSEALEAKEKEIAAKEAELAQREEALAKAMANKEERQATPIVPTPGKKVRIHTTEFVDCIIAGVPYILQKDKDYQVPSDVAAILTNAKQAYRN